MRRFRVRPTGFGGRRSALPGLLPLAVLLGGSFLTVADTVARAAWAPQQLPVGILTALLGVPAMLLVPDGVDANHPAPAVAVWHQHNGQYYLGKSEPDKLELEVP